MNKLFGKQEKEKEKEEKSRGAKEKEKESKSTRRAAQAPPSPPAGALGSGSPHSQSKAPAGPTAAQLLEAASADMRKPRWNFHCQLAHGSPTGTFALLQPVMLSQ